jgi:hypothetical protein
MRIIALTNIVAESVVVTASLSSGDLAEGWEKYGETHEPTRGASTCTATGVRRNHAPDVGRSLCHPRTSLRRGGLRADRPPGGSES